MSERAPMDGARAVVIGEGMDGLVAAHLLARAGRQAIVLAEREDHTGEGWVAPQIERALGLRGKITVRWDEPWAGKAAEAIRASSARDAARWPEFCARMHRLAGFLQSLYLEAPRAPLDLRFALRVRRLGRQGMEDLMRTLPMPIGELLDEWFESDALKGLLAASGVRGLRHGPRSAGTAFLFLHHHVGCPPGVFRPPRSNLRELLRGLPGIELRSARAARIVVRGARAAGVVLESGESLEAALVVSALDPGRTLLELADPAALDPELARAVRNIRARADVALPSDASSLDELERAYDKAKYGPRARAAHAELALDQALWMRPVPELARYRTPIGGLWLCGPSMHPGPGIAGAAGYNCVREILRQ